MAAWNWTAGEASHVPWRTTMSKPTSMIRSGSVSSKYSKGEIQKASRPERWLTWPATMLSHPSFARMRRAAATRKAGESAYKGAPLRIRFRLLIFITTGTRPGNASRDGSDDAAGRTRPAPAASGGPGAARAGARGRAGAARPAAPVLGRGGRPSRHTLGRPVHGGRRLRPGQPQ